MRIADRGNHRTNYPSARPLAVWTGSNMPSRYLFCALRGNPAVMPNEWPKGRSVGSYRTQYLHEVML